MNKNNFDEFFRKKFKDYGEVPDNKVWEAIESSLDQKRKKRVLLPIWWRLAGVAALLAVLFYIVNPFSSEPQTTIVNTENENGIQVEENLELLPESELNRGTNEGNELVETPVSTPQGLSSKQKDENSKQAATVTRSNQSEKRVDKNKARIDRVAPLVEQNSAQLAQGRPVQKEETRLDKSVKNSQEEMLTEKIEAGTQNIAETDTKNIPVSTKNNNDGDQEAVAIADKEKISIFDEIEKEEEVVATSNENKWSVGPTVAPVYFSSFGEGSPIHSNFVSNSKSGNLNLSYGLSVSYAISKKLRLRSGVHKVDYGYDTNDVQFSSSLAASTNNRIDNIDYALTSKNLIVQSNANGAPSQDAALAISDEIAAPNPTRDGRMVQQFGYLEIPIELNYALVDRKLGVHLIGGVSSLFLVDNTVSLESGGAATDIGEANNINDLNFSTNFGFGFNYEVSSKIQLHLEPMFKYQLNTFSGTAGDFQPFSLGVYSGLNFKF